MLNREPAIAPISIIEHETENPDDSLNDVALLGDSISLPSEMEISAFLQLLTDIARRVATTEEA